MASLKDQLDQAGYDTSTLDEGAVLKQLNDAGYDTSSFTPSNPSIMDRVKSAGSAIMNASAKVGNYVKAGAAGIGDIANIIIQPPTGNTLSDLGAGVQQGAQDVKNVEAGKPAETAAGQVGSTVGSFFTPNQIALQAAGGAVAKPIASVLGKVAAPVINGLVDNFPKVSKFIGVVPDAMTALVDNPEGVAAAKDTESIAKDAGAYVQGISQKGMAAAKAGMDALSDETEVKGAGDIAQKALGKLTNDKYANPLATEKLSDIVTKIQKDPSEATVGQAISDLDDLVNYNKASSPQWSQNLQVVRGQLSSMLKSQNQAYKVGMEAASATQDPFATLSKQLGVEDGFVNNSNTLSRLNNPALRGVQKALTAMPGGTQLAENAGNTAAKVALQKSLLGKAALKIVPNAGTVTSGAIQSIPAAGNAVYQGLQQ